jgi:hypothetical protein
MEVINRPQTQKETAPPNLPPIDDNNDNNDGHGGQGDDNKPKKGFGRPKRSLGWLIAGRVAFVICGAMLIVMVIGTFVSIYFLTAAPYLVPNVTDVKLRQDKIYLKFDDEDIFHELALVKDQPVVLDQREITQIPPNRNFTLIFTPKNINLPEGYKAYLTEGEKAGVALTADLEMFERRDTKNKGEESFNIIAIRPLPGKQWVTGKYEVVMPLPGMFASARYYAYFTINGA